MNTQDNALHAASVRRLETTHHPAIPNHNPTTGIRYGVVSLASLAEWVYDEFFHNGRDLAYESAREDAEAHGDYTDANGEFDEDAFNDDYSMSCADSCDYELTTTDDDGRPLRLGMSSLGGAPLVWVYESAYQCDCRPCSPCVPGAGDLDSDRDPNGTGTYDLPPSWYATADDE